MAVHSRETSRLKVEDRSADILQAAFAEFTECGYVATRMENIATRAGITKGLIYFYFKNKQDLFMAAFQECIKKPVINTMTNMRPSESMASHVVRVINNIYSAFIDAPFFINMVRLVLLEGQRFPELREGYLNSVVKPIIDALRSLMEEGARRGEWSKEAIPEFTHILMSPALFFAFWKTAFQEFQPLDTELYLREHQKVLLRSLGLDDAQIASAIAVAQSCESFVPDLPSVTSLLPPVQSQVSSSYSVLHADAAPSPPRRPLMRRARTRKGRLSGT